MTMSARAGILYESTRAPRRAPVSPAQAIITRDGQQAIRAELRRLRSQLDVDFATRLQDARTFGDSSENDDYLQIKEEEAVVTSRILHLESVLRSATVVDQQRHRNGIAVVGSVVEVEDLASGTTRQHRLAGGYERLDQGEVSANSPIGRALLGRSAGDEVEVQLPDGARRRLRITDVHSSSRTKARPTPA
jgi:transcription elongation factor GreA